MGCVGTHSRTWGIAGAKPFSLVIVALIAVASAMPLGGCAVKLAPEYDKAIFDGLTKANEEAMTLFASVAAGATKATFSKREAAYDSVIGTLDAVRLQVTSRVTPESPALMSAIVQRTAPSGNAATTVAGLPAIPSQGSLARMIQTVTSMRNVDSHYNLTPMLVMGFKMRFEISMEQALTYEKALNR
jgi:hypothetical protein